MPFIMIIPTSLNVTHYATPAPATSFTQEQTKAVLLQFWHLSDSYFFPAPPKSNFRATFWVRSLST